VKAALGARCSSAGPTASMANLPDVGELRYAVVLEPCPASEGGGFTVTVPALPEIVTQGEDLEDALAMARDAIELSLSVRRDEGDEIPPSDAKYARLEIVAVSVPAA
jgi:antitoxin HicB